MIFFENTIIVIVDVRSNQDAIQIVDKQFNEYVDEVETKAVESLIIIHWKEN